MSRDSVNTAGPVKAASKQKNAFSQAQRNRSFCQTICLPRTVDGFSGKETDTPTYSVFIHGC